MPEAPQGDYQSVSDMEGKPVSGKKFFVLVTGHTNGAHQAIVSKLLGRGHIQEFTPEQSDYFLVFCPIASRVGTDISEALESIPGNKPTILVVMHHTFNPSQIVADSRRQVEDPKVYLTVDCLFYEGKLLNCDRNDIAWFEICRCLGISTSPVSRFRCIRNIGNWFWNNRRLAISLACGIVLILIIGIIIAVEGEKKNALSVKTEDQSAV